MTETVQKTTLPNGVRVVTESISYVQSVSVGIWVATGARYEEPERRGISHFLEHMLFKGTKRRPTAKHIADEMDAVGGYLNAFTDKEYTCYYARALSEHLPLCVDILSDMYMNPLFDAAETAKERNVVLEEIKRRDDDPDDLVHDLFAQTIFPEHPLGLPVIGTAEVVAGLTPENLRDYMGLRYGPDAVIVSASGNLEHERVVELVQNTLGGLSGASEHPEHSFAHPKTDTLQYARPDAQVNLCVGTRGFGQFDEDKYTLAIIDNVLGGSMGARLFQEIRENRGLAYSVGSYAAMHREGGYFTAFVGTSPEHYELCLDLIRQEFQNVRKNGITEDEMQRAKAQYRSGQVLKMESMSSRMNRMGLSEVYFNRVIPLDEVLALIEAVTHEDILRVAERIFPEDPSELTIAAVGPFKKKRASSRNGASASSRTRTKAAAAKGVAA